MAYATITEINAYIAKLAPDGTTSPSTTQCATIQAGVEGELNVRLAVVGIVVPFAPTVATEQVAFAAWLKAVSCWGAAATILHDLLPGVEGPDEAPLWSFYEKKYQAALKGIGDLSLMPPSLGAVVAGGEPASYGTRYPDTPPDDGVNAEPIFNRNDSLITGRKF